MYLSVLLWNWGEGGGYYKTSQTYNIISLKKKIHNWTENLLYRQMKYKKLPRFEYETG